MPTMFLPLVGNSAHFELRTAGDPTALVKQVRAIVAQADNNLPLFDVRTQTQQIEQSALSGAAHVPPVELLCRAWP